MWKGQMLLGKLDIHMKKTEVGPFTLHPKWKDLKLKLQNFENKT